VIPIACGWAVSWGIISPVASTVSDRIGRRVSLTGAIVRVGAATGGIGLATLGGWLIAGSGFGSLGLSCASAAPCGALVLGAGSLLTRREMAPAPFEESAAATAGSRALAPRRFSNWSRDVSYLTFPRHPGMWWLAYMLQMG
jgi:hypothetical protein